jgi:hypothetical protein
MKKYTLLFLILINVTLTSCKNEEQEPKQKPGLMATKDAIWKFHFKGEYSAPPAETFTDTSMERLVTVEATGVAEVFNGKKYWWYKATVERYKGGQYLETITGKMLLREDADAQAVYMLKDLNIWLGREVETVTFNEAAGGDGFDWRTGPVTFFEDGEITIGSIRTPRYVTQTDGQKRFFKAKGIGDRFGIFSANSDLSDGGYVRSMDFIYKGDTLHFEY